MVDNEESVYSANTREGPYFLPHLAYKFALMKREMVRRYLRRI